MDGTAEDLVDTEDPAETEEVTIAFEVEDGTSGSLYTNLDVEKSQIRLLYINESPCCSDAAICCDLYKVSLDENPDYAALSYCWGDANDKVEISLGGKTVSITKNLEAALRRLRDMPHEHFCADAICINQDDLDERGQQVGIMYDIYATATMVYSYLNEGRPRGEARSGAPNADAALVEMDEDGDAEDGDAEDGNKKNSRGLRRFSLPASPTQSDAPRAQRPHTDLFPELDLAVLTTDTFDLDVGENKPDEAADTEQSDALGVADEAEKTNEQTKSTKASVTVEADGVALPRSIEPPVDYAGSEIDLGLFWCNIFSEQLKPLADPSLEAEKQIPRRQDSMTVLVNKDAIPCIMLLMDNPYWSRVWIFQETVRAEEQVFLGPRTSTTRSDLETVCRWLRQLGDGEIVRPHLVDHEIWMTWKKASSTSDMRPLSLRRCRALADKIDRYKPKTTLTGPRNELFEFSQTLGAKDPRDHIYGVLGVLDVRFRPDYHRTIKGLYCSWAQWLALSVSNWGFDFLRRAGIGKNSANDYDLPSWVPDWTAGLQGSIRIADDKSILFLDGVVVDTVAARRGRGKGLFMQYYLHLSANGHPIRDPPLQVLFRALTRDSWPGCSKGKYDPYNPMLLSAFISFAVLVMNSDPEVFVLMDAHPLLWSPVSWAVNEYWGMDAGAGDKWSPLQLIYTYPPPEHNDMTTGDKVMDGLLQSLLDLTRDGFEMLGNDDHLLESIMESISLFRTTKGYIGSSGTSVEAGDLVCVMAGCPNPLVLRKVEDHFIIIEPCYIHGLMYGEVMQLLANGQCEPQRTFEIC